MKENKKHTIVKELQILRESSKNSVAQGATYSFDEFNEYLHIEREVEKTLRKQIVHCANQKKAQLVMVCGNVGDGKSHILSYLNKELKDEMDQFTIHNDATESHNPNETSSDTLYKVLNGFKDKNIENSNSKVILAINLGTLNNFLEKHGSEYNYLKGYVSEKKILDTDIVEDDFNNYSFFYHVNFADYHMYSLTEKGPKSLVITTLLKKLVTNEHRNPIFKAYLKFKLDCSFATNCPILYNFEYLFKEENQEALTSLIIQSIINSKEIVSVRSLLNFFYDLIVPVELNWENLDIYETQLDNLSESQYLSYLIPNYIFDHPELSSLFNKISKLDPCIYRFSELDTNLIQLINSEKPGILFKKFIDHNIVKGIESKLIKNKLDNRELTKLFIRLNFFKNHKNMMLENNPDFHKYTRMLYQFNNNNIDSIKKIYNLVTQGARKWYGDPKNKKKVIINLGKTQSKYRVFKDFKAKPVLVKKKERINTLLTKFLQEFILQFKIDGESEPICIHIDYSLYEILTKVLNGYRPNKRDNSNYVSFVSAINKLINQDNETSPLEIDEVNIGNKIDYELSKGSFGEFEFRIL